MKGLDYGKMEDVLTGETGDNATNAFNCQWWSEVYYNERKAGYLKSTYRFGQLRKEEFISFPLPEAELKRITEAIEDTSVYAIDAKREVIYCDVTGENEDEKLDALAKALQSLPNYERREKRHEKMLFDERREKGGEE